MATTKPRQHDRRSERRITFQPIPVAIDCVGYGAQVWMRDLSSGGMNAMCEPDAAAILNTGAEFRYSYDFDGGSLPTGT